MLTRPQTEGRPYQTAEVEKTWSYDAHGLFWEQGTGKSWVGVQTACELFHDGKIQVVVVIAPKQIPHNWVYDEFPKHADPRVLESTRAMVWETSKSRTKKFQREWEEFTSHDGLKIVAVNYDALVTERARDAIRALLKRYKSLGIVDEGHYIKGPDSRRTRVVLAASLLFTYKRLLTGTPVAHSPMDLYSQLRFLDERIWWPLGIRGHAAFKATFGVWREIELEPEKRDASGKLLARRKAFQKLVELRNLTKLRDTLASCGSRIRKADVLTDLPPKSYSTRYFDLTAEQRRVYNAINDEFVVDFADGSELYADMAITRRLRKMQVTAGYLPREDDDELRPIPGLEKSNPRVDLTVGTVEDAQHQCIVWSRFTHTIDLLMRGFRDAKIPASRFDGQTDDPRREAQKFLAGDTQVIVGGLAFGAEGHTWNCAKTMIYCDNSDKLPERTQSEDRNHRIGQDMPVEVIDLAARDTIDLKVIENLRAARGVAEYVQGDPLTDW